VSRNEKAIATLIDEFGLEVPLVQGPMGGVAGPELVSAVANAGALGMLPIWPETVADAVALLRTTTSMTQRSFAVNLRADLLQLDHLAAATDAGVSIVHLFWGDPGPTMAAVTRNDIKMIATVADASIARRALDAGANALIAQGVEAGGHVMSDIPLAELLASVLHVAGEIPVIAAGGCADAESASGLMDQGAAGVLMGTRFVVCEESRAHDAYKQALVEAGDDDTARSLCFDVQWADAPHRTLTNSTYRAWDAVGQPPMGQRPGEGEIVMHAGGNDLPRYHVMPPTHEATGDVLGGALYAGTGAGKIADCPTAEQIVQRMRPVLCS